MKSVMSKPLSQSFVRESRRLRLAGFPFDFLQGFFVAVPPLSAEQIPSNYADDLPGLKHLNIFVTLRRYRLDTFHNATNYIRSQGCN